MNLLRGLTVDYNSTTSDSDLVALLVICKSPLFLLLGQFVTLGRRGFREDEYSFGYPVGITNVSLLGFVTKIRNSGNSLSCKLLFSNCASGINVGWKCMKYIFTSVRLIHLSFYSLQNKHMINLGTTLISFLYVETLTQTLSSEVQVNSLVVSELYKVN